VNGRPARSLEPRIHEPDAHSRAKNYEPFCKSNPPEPEALGPKREGVSFSFGPAVTTSCSDYCRLGAACLRDAPDEFSVPQTCTMLVTAAPYSERTLYGDPVPGNRERVVRSGVLV
jgi:hypothetical protein